MSSDGGSVGRRSFDRHIADDQLAALAARLRERGVPEYLIEREHDLTGDHGAVEVVDLRNPGLGRGLAPGNAAQQAVEVEVADRRDPPADVAGHRPLLDALPCELVGEQVACAIECHAELHRVDRAELEPGGHAVA